MTVKWDWYKVGSKKPPTFDLVSVRLEGGYEMYAWWTGQKWDCGKEFPEGKAPAYWARHRPFHTTTTDNLVVR